MLRSSSLALVATACGLAPHATVPAGERPDVRYTLELAEPVALHVRVELAAAPGGVTVFDLDPADDIFAHVVATADGRAVPIERSSSAWVVHSAAGAALVLSYDLAGREVDRSGGEYEPMVHAHLIHLFGDHGLVSPHHLDDPRPRRVEVRWAKFAAAGWTTLSSYGDAERTLVELPLGEFRDAVFLASDRVQVTRRTAGGTVLVAALVAAPWSFDARAFSDVLASLVAAERTLVGGPFPPVFLADLVPFVTGNESWNGTALHAAFTAQADPAFPLIRHGDQPSSLAWMFAHELFHTWNGRTIKPTVVDGEKWFTEGFTDFYARRAMARAGLATPADYAADLDATLQTYAMSPLRDRPDPPYASADASQRGMAYVRGDLLATAVDAEIRKVSTGRRGLDDVMRELVADARAGGRVDATRLVARFERETSPAFAAKLRRVLERGGPIDLDPASFEPCLHGEVRDIAPFDLGFDPEASGPTQRVVGLRPDSALAAQGVVEGDELAGVSFTGQRTDQPVVLHIRRNGVEHAVTYLPAGPARPVLVFSVGDARACGARL